MPPDSRSHASRRRFAGLATLLASLLIANAEVARQGVGWHPETQRFDADLRDWPLEKVLQTLAARTGWQVYWDTNAQPVVNSRFSSLPVQEALGRLVGNLNFSLVPRTNAPAQLFVFQTSVNSATQLIVAPPPPTASRAITNELIIRLRPGSGTDIRALAARLGAKVVGQVDELNAYRLRFDTEEATQKARTELIGDDDVASVESNFSVTPPTQTLPLSTGLPPLNLKASSGAAGGQVVVALLDTPVSADSPALTGFLLPSLSVAGTADPTASTFSHGQAMAEILLRAVAAQTQGGESSVRIQPVDIYGGQSTTSTFDIVRGLYAAAASQPSFINLSLAGEGDSPLLHDALTAFTQKGVGVFAAAGNEPTTAPMFPAAWPEVYAVTAGDRNGQLSAYANRGSFVDLLAPGTGIVQVNGQSFAVSGTSTATANVSGVAAALFSQKGLSMAEVLATLSKEFPFGQPGSSPTSATAPSAAPGTR